MDVESISAHNDMFALLVDMEEEIAWVNKAEESSAKESRDTALFSHWLSCINVLIQLSSYSVELKSFSIPSRVRESKTPSHHHSNPSWFNCTSFK